MPHHNQTSIPHLGTRPENRLISYGRVNLRHRTYYCDYSHWPAPPPLQVTYVGNIRYPYDSGSYWQRVDSEVFVVELVTAGDLSLVQDGRSYVIGPGQVMLCRKHSTHRFEAGPARFALKRFMMIEGEMLDTVLDMTGLAGCDVVHPANPTAVAHLMRHAIRIMARRLEGFDLRLSAMAYELLLLLGRDAHQENRPQELDSALAFLRRGLCLPISSREIATHVSMSVPSLNRLFRKHLGVSPIGYLIEQKMAFARQLLATTDLPVKSIAWQTGYRNPLYFSSRFHKHAGLSPREYRIRHRGKIAFGEGQGTMAGVGGIM